MTKDEPLGRSLTTEVTVPPPLADSLAWAADGQAHLRGLMTRMGDEAFGARSLLEDWTRADVLMHIARSADTAIDLLSRLRTGEPVPSVPTRHEDGFGPGTAPEHAGWTADQVRAAVVDASDRLADAVRKVPDDAWRRPVRTSEGVEVPATEILWVRAREVWIHAVDLDVGASFKDLPIPMRQVLVADVTTTLAARPGCPRVRIEEVRTGEVLEFGPGPTTPDDGAPGDLGTVRGKAHDLMAWLLGRPPGKGLRTADGDRPGTLPTWL
ncbi:maleylpyruvate isomerase family mycothiol-dependent enzyme [Pseudonocardia phyllosphaerae]|uniref:maleylpyruvate isomerase family mycothiol-dependent enzyme n=1 Tax=Pseudonocardia phyllosphaerae TaxID=3390502 RepID=UPI00397A382E